MVEHSAVNRRVVGSSPTRGATSHQATLTWPHRKSDGVIVLCRWCSFSEKSHACCGYALVNAGITPPLRYQLFSVLKSIVSIIFDKRKWFANFLYTETNIHSVRLNHVGVSSAYNPPSKRWGICLLCYSVNGKHGQWSERISQFTKVACGIFIEIIIRIRTDKHCCQWQEEARSPSEQHTNRRAFIIDIVVKYTVKYNL